ncbi:putative signaling protein [Pigmentiphaga litoralis]|uniref:putative bifunctional diguanylate cyclase/phosphodiesterase n=1 Tax=Pigmentiphaga litoralis TaxID=516702 RepID=UPI001671C53F|nr:putative signaling protein [Pigmentiphaga litoralis]
MLESTYSYPLVLLSFLIATVAAFTSLDLTGRIASLPRASNRTFWLSGGAVALGLGIWSMHFIGMLAFSLPIPLGYDLATTLYSLALVIGVAYLALHQVTQRTLTRPRLLVGAVVVGLGISGMHYMGMAALQMSPGIDYSLPRVLLSVAIAVAASFMALRLAFALRSADRQRRFRQRLAAAMVMGAAICSMHYTGMWAAEFPIGVVCLAAGQIDIHWLAATILAGTLGVLGVALVLSVLDSRLQDRTLRFNDTLRSANEMLLYQATHDELTGLPNRGFLAERLEQAILFARSNDKRFAVYFIDIDGFKAINDSLGHNVGDAVLRELACRLRLKLRREDVVARFGGDEFVVVVENLSTAAIAGDLAEKLLDCFQEEFDLVDTHMTVSPSIGISVFPEDGQTSEALLKNADAAMYEVKNAGRNGYRFFEAAMNTSTQRAMNLQRSLRGAVAANQLHIHYQPKFDCTSGKLLGAEALLRWTHSELGPIEPSEFIPIAERSGNITRIGQWVIKAVCQQIRMWDDAGLAPVKIAINLSPIQLRSSSLIREVIELTKEYGVAPSRLMFEITESVAMQNAEETMKAVQRLQQAGFEMAIDDFGTGYSSLSYLQQFAVRQLKVDRLFVNELDVKGSKSRSIVSAIIGLAHALDMEVVAEGVETASQLAMLAEMKCDQAQGFLLARPLGVVDFSRLMGMEPALV